LSGSDRVPVVPHGPRTPMIPKVLPTGPPAGFDPVEHIDLPLHGWQEGEAGRRQRKPYDPWRKVNP
jgi:hypothetical protein